ncbi:MAG: nucleotidyltransferase family protein [Anaerolineaceae bacterium]|nr:nucleotidyltransferase family protein [Anaerolineaceae bacterium]
MIASPLKDHPYPTGVVLAAGLSRRMGQPKMVMPWGETTIIGQVVTTLLKAGLTDLFVVTGGAHTQVEAAIKGFPAHTIFNSLYANGEMLTSIQTGLKALAPQVEAAMIALGDQPKIQLNVIQAVVETARMNTSGLIVPSFKMRRGHPWIIKRELWTEVLDLRPPDTLRNFMHRHTDEICYLVVDTPTILQDLDTPEDYLRERP